MLSIKKAKKRRKKKATCKSYSKLIFNIITMMVILIVAFTCYMVLETKDMSVLQVLIPCVFAEFATATGFYYSKAKAENVIKIQNNQTYDQQCMEGENNGK